MAVSRATFPRPSQASVTSQQVFIEVKQRAEPVFQVRFQGLFVREQLIQSPVICAWLTLLAGTPSKSGNAVPW